MRVTLEEIAKIAGVSKATVSRVLNNSPVGVSSKTRQHVQEVIRSTNYDRNGHYDLMRSRNIALVLPDISNPFFSELAKAVEATAYEKDYYVLLANTEFSEKKESEHIARFASKKIDGLILVTSGNTVNSCHFLPQKSGIAMLLLDRKLNGAHNFPGVYSDTEYAAFKSCETMIQHGSTKIAFIGGTQGTSTSVERLNGYKDALRHYGLEYNKNLICNGNYTSESGYEAVINLVRSNVEFSAILAANDLMALGAIRALKEFQFKVPDDVEIIGFDNIPYSSLCEPALSTCQQPTIEMGKLAVEGLLKQIDGKEKVPDQRLRPRLLLRASTKGNGIWTAQGANLQYRSEPI